MRFLRLSWFMRAIPTRDEMEVTLNTLLAMGLIEQQDNKFFISEAQYRCYDEFQKRKRKSRFDTVKMYFKRLRSYLFQRKWWAVPTLF